MKRVLMLDDHEGCKKGDVVGFENDAEADALIEAGKAELPPAPEAEAAK